MANGIRYDVEIYVSNTFLAFCDICWDNIAYYDDNIYEGISIRVCPLSDVEFQIK